MRAGDDLALVEWVSKVGDGTANEPFMSDDIRIPDEYVLVVSADEEAVVDRLVTEVCMVCAYEGLQ